jgi:oxygen-dependent protoporphyrinogen oxidase
MARAWRGDKEIQPHSGETVASWARRLVNEEILQQLLAPALNGIYAGDPECLSASMVLGGFFKPALKRGELKGSVAPQNGMGQLLTALVQDLKASGAKIQLESEISQTVLKGREPIVLCGSAESSAHILQSEYPKVSELLLHCEYLPVATATLFFEKSGQDQEGFGCLFPKEQRFNSLGVLFNECIFAGRSKVRSETWILGGKLNADITRLNPDGILKSILQDRERFSAATSKPLHHVMKVWPKALPHCTVEWEKSLSLIPEMPNIHLHGNYLGDLGLTRILERSKALAQEIQRRYG